MILSCLLSLLCVSAVAQTTSQLNVERPYIEVTGTAEMEIVPNEIYIAITLLEREEGRETITIEKQEAELKAGLAKIGVSLENLSLADADANFIRVKWTRKEVVARSEYLLKVEDAVTVGKVFEKLDELKIKNCRISKVSHSEIERFRKEVKIEAIKAAKEKADYLLEAIGEKTGKALIVRESENIEARLRNIPSMQSNSSMYQEYETTSSTKQIIQFRKITIRSGMYVKFEIQ